MGNAQALPHHKWSLTKGLVEKPVNAVLNYNLSRKQKRHEKCVDKCDKEVFRFGRRRSRRRRSRRSRMSRRRRSRRSRRSRRRRFGYSHDMGPKIYNARMQDGILLADNAFTDGGNPLTRALMAGSG